MTPEQPTETGDRLPLSSPIVGALSAAAVVFASWRVFVGTVRGQQLDQLALVGSNIGAARVDSQLGRLLDSVSVPAVAVLIGAALLIAGLRGRWRLGFVAAAVIGAANVTTQVLKYWVFDREDLLGLGALNVTNTLPSGHVTVAAAGVVGLLLVVPPLLRSLTAISGAVIVVAFGFATLANQWHRPSDVLAAVAVAVAWAMVGVVILRAEYNATGGVEVPHRPGAVSVVLVTAAIAGLGAAAAAGALVWGVAPGASDRGQQFLAYAAGMAAVTGLACAGLGALVRLIDATRPAPRH